MAKRQQRRPRQLRKTTRNRKTRRTTRQIRKTKTRKTKTRKTKTRKTKTRQIRKTKTHRTTRKRLQTELPSRNSKLISISTQDDMKDPLNNSKKSENIKRMFYSILYKNMQNKDTLCQVMNVDQETINLPKEYPGDEWVHANLMGRRDMPINLFESDHIKSQYNKYRQMCR